MCSKWTKNLCWTQKIPTSMKIICLETGPRVYGGPPFLNSSSLDSHCCVCYIRSTPLIPSVVQLSSWKNFSWFLLKAIKWVSHWLTHVVKSYDQLVSQFLHFFIFKYLIYLKVIIYIKNRSKCTLFSRWLFPSCNVIYLKGLCFMGFISIFSLPPLEKNIFNK